MCKQGETVSFMIYNAGGESRVIDVDFCIAEFVRALNVMGFVTVASCCGHGKRPGNIALADGREIIIAPDFRAARTIDLLFESLNPTEENKRLISIGELRLPEIDQAIADAEEGRRTHVEWRDYLQSCTDDDCENCRNAAEYGGNLEHQKDWIEKYDRILRILNSIQLWNG